VLPSAPLLMIKRKISKKVGMLPDEVRLWTVKRVQGDLVAEDEKVWKTERVMQVDEGEVGYWFDDGDGVIVEND